MKRNRKRNPLRYLLPAPESGIVLNLLAMVVAVASVVGYAILAYGLTAMLAEWAFGVLLPGWH